ncbi:MAG: CAP domain-containing protein, partial [Actinomycetota bacterium]|nr:CAP domain-containing protein [Actinomycetota bacterium]
RMKRDLPPLKWCARCAEVARAHSKDMYRNGYFSHVDLDGNNPFERMRDQKIRYESAGENLVIAPSIDEAHRGLMRSADHRANILRQTFDEVGIGIYKGPYGFMCTQVFRDAL